MRIAADVVTGFCYKTSFISSSRSYAARGNTFVPKQHALMVLTVLSKGGPLADQFRNIMQNVISEFFLMR